LLLVELEQLPLEQLPLEQFLSHHQMKTVVLHFLQQVLVMVHYQMPVHY
jgi:hypothetical protein